MRLSSGRKRSDQRCPIRSCIRYAPTLQTWRKKHGGNFRAFCTASDDRMSLPEAYHGAHASIFGSMYVRNIVTATFRKNVISIGILENLELNFEMFELSRISRTSECGRPNAPKIATTTEYCPCVCSSVGFSHASKIEIFWFLESIFNPFYIYILSISKIN